MNLTLLDIFPQSQGIFYPVILQVQLRKHEVREEIHQKGLVFITNWIHEYQETTPGEIHFLYHQYQPIAPQSSCGQNLTNTQPGPPC